MILDPYFPLGSSEKSRLIHERCTHYSIRPMTTFVSGRSDSTQSA